MRFLKKCVVEFENEMSLKMNNDFLMKIKVLGLDNLEEYMFLDDGMIKKIKIFLVKRMFTLINGQTKFFSNVLMSLTSSNTMDLISHTRNIA